MKRFVLALFAVFTAQIVSAQFQPGQTSGSIYYSGGNVGIGTSNPQQKLDVFGRVRLTEGSNLSEIFTGSSGGLTALHIGTISTVPVAFYTGSGSPQMVLVPAGNVGIGTTSPVSKLDVRGAAWFENGVTDHAIRILPGGSGGETHLIEANYRTAGFLALRLSANSPNHPNQLHLDTFGKVGIGGAPTERMEIFGPVGGHLMLKLNAAVDGYPQLGFYENSALKWNLYNDFVTDGFGIGNAGGPRLHITPNGNVGIGTTVPAVQRLEILGNTRVIAGDLWLDNDRVIRAGGGNQGILYRAATNGIFLGSGDTNDFLVFNAGGAEKVRITTAGNLGVGTATPGIVAPNGFVLNANSRTLEIKNPTAGDYVGLFLRRNDNAVGLDITSDGQNAGIIYFDSRFAVASSGGFLFRTQTNGIPVNVVRIMGDGSVGIGTTTPAKMLHVTGDIQVDGNINAKYQDVAEWVPSSDALEPGTVVVLDPLDGERVKPSTTPYDTSVAGVVSAQPGIVLGEAGPEKAMIATTGRVRVRVDATNAPIRVGDLLVTSSKPGVSMRSQAIEINGRTFHQPGTIIGKALQPLESGQGEILVLLSLQ